MITDVGFVIKIDHCEGDKALLNPPQRTWVGLTDNDFYNSVSGQG